jgi:plastocyanin
VSPGRLATLGTLAASALAASVLAIPACFSERSAPTGPISGVECRIPLGPDVVGSTLVVIRDFSFQPAEIRIRAGGTVTWINCDDPGQPAHTSTADQGAWNSPSLNPGDVFSSAFAQAGTFAYHCEPHPFMIATVIVE